MDVAVWLKSLRLERYQQAFCDHDIDAEVLPQLTAEDLIGLGVASIGHRRRLLAAIASLRDGTPQAEVSSLQAGPALAAATAAPKPTAAERRQLTVMFVDLVGSTPLATRLDPEEMREVLRAYQNTVAGEVARFEGHIAKFMGDGVLCYFGWPRAHEDAAERAVRTGLAVVEAVQRLRTPIDEPLRARVGIATGTVVVGELIGEGAAQEEEVVGETPNLAARLQQLTAPGTVVIADATRRLVAGLFELERLGPQRLKGFAEPLAAWRVTGESQAEGRFEARQAAGLAPLIGREEELALLLDRWRLARGGEGQVVLLSGEPGIGKSRLVLALRERLRVENRFRISYTCSPYHANSTLWPVIRQIERAAGFTHDDDPARRLAKLESLTAQAGQPAGETMTLLAELLNLPGDGRLPLLALTPQQKKARTLEALVAQLEGLARERPVLVILEDAHWLDPTTKELFDLVIDRIRRLRVLLLVTFRPELTPPWAGFPHVTLLTLNRLARGQAEALISRVVGERALPEDVTQAIVARTEGVPLFVEELTKAVLESGLAREAASGAAPADPLPPSLAIPATLQDSLMARLDRLGPVKEVAQTAACIGRDFGHDVLAAVAGVGEAELRDALNQLAQSGLVFRRSAPPEAAYTFKHALVRDTAYESLLRSRRQQLHGRIADVLERQGPGVAEVEPETLAHHLTEAGLAERAVEYWLKAGQRASSRSAHKEAISHLTRGLAVLARVPAAAECARRELELQIALGPPLIATRGFAAPEVELAYARAQELACELGEQAHLATALRGLCYVHHVRARLRYVDGLTTRLLRLTGETPGPIMQADAHNAAGFNLFHLGRFAPARDHLQRAVEQLERSGGLAHAMPLGVSIGVFNRAYAAHCDWHLGRPGHALANAQQAIDLARQLAHPFSLAVALAYAAMLHQFRQEPDRVRERAEAVLAVSGEHGFSYYRAWAAILAGWATAVTDDVTDAILRIRHGLTGIHATGAELRLPYYLGLLSELHLRAGQTGMAAGVLDEAFAIAERNEETWNNTNLWLLRGDIRLATAADDQEEAESCYARAVDLARAQGAASLVLRGTLRLAGLWGSQGRRAEARALLASALRRFDGDVATPELEEAKVLLGQLS